MNIPEPVKADMNAGDDGPETRAASVSRLFREHNRTLVGFLFARLRNEQEAREIAQEAYVKVLQLEQKPGATSFLRAYLFRVAENLALDRLRQRRNRGRIDQLDTVEEMFAEPEGERRAIAQQELILLRRIVAELPPRCAEAFRLHKLEDQPFPEVAASMQMSERMVRKHVTRALVYIRLRREGVPSNEAWTKVKE